MTPDIVVQIKGGPTKVITQPAGAATRLVQLGDVSATGILDSEVLTYVAANNQFEFQTPVKRTSISVLSPLVTDNITFFFTEAARTFNKVVSVVQGTDTPNVVFQLSYMSTRITGTVGTPITGNITCANTTNGVFTTTLTNATVPANNYVVLQFSTVSGTVDEISVTMIG